jgi:hypothetical protein
VTTKKQLLSKAREIIWRYDAHELWNDDDLKSFSDLTGEPLSGAYRSGDPSVYPELRDCKDRASRAEASNQRPIPDEKMNCLFVLHLDGTAEPRYKWTNKVTRSNDTHDKMIKELLRKTISHQIRSYRENIEENIGMVCFSCGCKSGDFHVDHTYPPFRHIVFEWLDEHGAVETIKGHNGRIFANECDERSWQEYHAERALLQMLCGKCNIRKSDNITITGISLSTLASGSGCFSVPENEVYKRYT